MQNLTHLLNQVAAINTRYKDIGKITGENFNLFRLLGMASLEVRTHSLFLTELLNPQGSHQQGSVFLQLFLDLNQLKDFDAPSAQAVAEKYIGVNSDQTGGRIDIVLTDKLGKRILIENKIYAADQKNQLLRYYNYDRQATLLYLTLNGDEATEWSTGKELTTEHYKPLCYKKKIVEWLEACRKEAVNLPILRETITQYIYLVKYLTNQTLNHSMQEEIVTQILKTDESLQAFLAMTKAKGEVYNQIFARLNKDLQTSLTNSTHEQLKGLSLIFDMSLSAVSGFTFREAEMTKQNLEIRFEFAKKDAQELFFGFHYIDSGKSLETPSSPGELFWEKFGKESRAEHWYTWAWCLDFMNWNDEKVIVKVVHQNKFTEYVMEIVKDMMDMVKPAES